MTTLRMKRHTFGLTVGLWQIHFVQSFSVYAKYISSTYLTYFRGHFKYMLQVKYVTLQFMNKTSQFNEKGLMEIIIINIPNNMLHFLKPLHPMGFQYEMNSSVNLEYLNWFWIDREHFCQVLDYVCWLQEYQDCNS